MRPWTGWSGSAAERAQGSRQRYQKARAGQGDAVVHINSRALAAIPVSIPSHAEQDAIADVLADADRELKTLQLPLAKALAIKTGTMQQLLTGLVRLPV